MRAKSSQSRIVGTHRPYIEWVLVMLGVPWFLVSFGMVYYQMPNVLNPQAIIMVAGALFFTGVFLWVSAVRAHQNGVGGEDLGSVAMWTMGVRIVLSFLVSVPAGIILLLIRAN